MENGGEEGNEYERGGIFARISTPLSERMSVNVTPGEGPRGLDPRETETRGDISSRNKKEGKKREEM